MDELYTENLSVVLTYAGNIARDANHGQLFPSHLLFALLSKGGTGLEVLERLDVDIPELQNTLEGMLGNVYTADGTPTVSDSAQLVLDTAQTYAQRLEDSHIGTEHLLYGLAASDSPGTLTIRTELMKHGATQDAVDLKTREVRAESHAYDDMFNAGGVVYGVKVTFNRVDDNWVTEDGLELDDLFDTVYANELLGIRAVDDDDPVELCAYVGFTTGDGIASQTHRDKEHNYTTVTSLPEDTYDVFQQNERLVEELESIGLAQELELPINEELRPYVIDREQDV